MNSPFLQTMDVSKLYISSFMRNFEFIKWIKYRVSRKPYHDIIIQSINIQVCLCSFGIDEEELWELWKFTPPSTFKGETTSAYRFKIVVFDLKRGPSYTVSLSHTPSSANICISAVTDSDVIVCVCVCVCVCVLKTLGCFSHHNWMIFCCLIGSM